MLVTSGIRLALRFGLAARGIRSGRLYAFGDDLDEGGTFRRRVLH